MIVDPTRRGPTEHLGQLHQVKATGNQEVEIPVYLKKVKIQQPPKGIDFKKRTLSHLPASSNPKESAVADRFFSNRKSA